VTILIGNKQIITIKGTREGLSLHMDDACSFEDLLKELEEKLAANRIDSADHLVGVHIQLGNRYLYKEQEEILCKMITSKQRLKIESIHSDVITKQAANEWKEEAEVKAVSRVVRSGQVLEVKGDLLLLGDVNPGGCVTATGNIFVMGNLLGIAHAGKDGNADAVIAASYMNPTQLRIADYISRAPDHETDGVYMECGHIDDEQEKIIIDRLQAVIRKRPGISSFERRMLNG
jgi:septum site-determining protein MinC